MKIQISLSEFLHRVLIAVDNGAFSSHLKTLWETPRRLLRERHLHSRLNERPASTSWERARLSIKFYFARQALAPGLRCNPSRSA